METPRFNGGARQRAISRPVIERHRKWIEIRDLKSLGNVARSPQRRIFAIVPRAKPNGPDGRMQRRILIFDNHPDSLRLLSNSAVFVNDEADAVSRRERHRAIICGSILIVMSIAAILWWLLS
jgi:hypothetical protein